MTIGNSVPYLGGAEIQALRLAAALVRRGHEVDLVSLRLDRSQPLLERIDGVVVRRCPVLRWTSPAGRPRLSSISSAPAVLRCILSLRPRPEVVHLHLLSRATLAAAAAARTRGLGVLAKLGNSGPRFDFVQVRETHGEGILINALFRRWVDVFVAPSRAVEGDLRAAGIPAARIQVIPNGVEIDSGPGAAVEGREARDRTRGRGEGAVATLVYCGSFTPKKNLTILMDALARLRAAGDPPVRLVLVGDGPERASLQERARGLPVTFPGAVTDVRPFLAAADAFVLPSHTEGLSNALLEAMAAGLPCVATAVGGNVELVAGAVPGEASGETRPALAEGDARKTPHGYLVRPGDAAGLARAIKELLADPGEAEAAGRRARELVTRFYSIDAVAGRYEELYARLREPARRRR